MFIMYFSQLNQILKNQPDSDDYDEIGLSLQYIMR